MRALFWLALIPALLAAPVRAVEPQGTVVAIGGALRSDNERIWARMIELAGGPQARFVVLGTASENPQRAAQQVVDQLQRRGVQAESLPVSPRWPGSDPAQAVRDPALIAKLQTASAVFFTGGSQERIVDTLQPGGQRSPLLEAIWALYRRGGVVAGTSAGAAIMSQTMFRDAPSVIGVMKGRWAEGKEVDRGLGFVGPDLFIDQHALRRGRFGRMIPLMLAKGHVQGLGIEEDSAAVIRGGTVEILGSRGALFVDLRQAKAEPGPLQLRGARLSYLEQDDRIELGSGVLHAAPHKTRAQRLKPGALDYKPYYLEPLFVPDLLGDSAISNAMSYLIDSTQEEVHGLAFEPMAKSWDPLAALGFVLRLYKGPESIGWSTDEKGTDDYTVFQLRLDITPTRLPQPLLQPWKP